MHLNEPCPVVKAVNLRFRSTFHWLNYVHKTLLRRIVYTKAVPLICPSSCPPSLRSLYRLRDQFLWTQSLLLTSPRTPSIQRNKSWKMSPKNENRKTIMDWICVWLQRGNEMRKISTRTRESSQFPAYMTRYNYISMACVPCKSEI